MLRTPWTTWRERGLYLLTAVVLIFIGVLPMQSRNLGAAVPDLTFCVTVAWVMRRPESAPAILVAIVCFAGDVLFGRPLGIWSFLMVAGTEYFRNRETGKGLQMRLLEWLSVAILFGIMLIAYRVILYASLTPAPGLPALFWHFLVTVLAYPPTVAVLYWLLKVRAPLPADRSRSIGRVA